MSARTCPCGEFVILTATLSLSYAFRRPILFLYRALYAFKGLAPTCAAVSLPLYEYSAQLHLWPCSTVSENTFTNTRRTTVNGSIVKHKLDFSSSNITDEGTRLQQLFGQI